MKYTPGAKFLLFNLLICIELTKEKEKQQAGIPTLI